MPSSHFRNIPVVIQALRTLNPRRVLDVGVGCGKYGLLAREYLEVWGHEFEPWRKNAIIVDGIEVFEPYITAVHRAVYDHLFVGEAVSVLAGMPARSYDVVVAVEVLEHFDQEQGAIFLSQLARVSRAMILTTPTKYKRTSAAFGNSYEVHQTVWDRDMLAAYGEVAVFQQDASLIASVTFPDESLIEGVVG